MATWLFSQTKFFSLKNNFFFWKVVFFSDKLLFFLKNYFFLLFFQSKNVKKKRNTRPFVTLVTNRNALRYVTLQRYETLLSRNGMLSRNPSVHFEISLFLHVNPSCSFHFIETLHSNSNLFVFIWIHSWMTLRVGPFVSPFGFICFRPFKYDPSCTPSIIFAVLRYITSNPSAWTLFLHPSCVPSYHSHLFVVPIYGFERR